MCKNGQLACFNFSVIHLVNFLVLKTLKYVIETLLKWYFDILKVFLDQIVLSIEVLFYRIDRSLYMRHLKNTGVFFKWLVFEFRLESFKSLLKMNKIFFSFLRERKMIFTYLVKVTLTFGVYFTDLSKSLVNFERLVLFSRLFYFITIFLLRLTDQKRLQQNSKVKLHSVLSRRDFVRQHF